MNQKVETGIEMDTDETTINQPDGKRIGKHLELVLLALVPALLALYLVLSHPFKETLVTRSIDLEKYSSSQRLNFVTAAKALDGAVIKPHAVFSFNGRVGRRLSKWGFVPAAGYLDGQKTNTEGGGICLVSSTLYQLALLSGLQIVERSPHTSTVRSVAPGLDATVWYGRADLKFKNPYDSPIAIYCCQDGDRLSISLNSDAITKFIVSGQEHSFRRCQIACGPDSKNLLVEVFLKDGRREHLISRDRYHCTQ